MTVWVDTPIRALASCNIDALPETYPADREIHYLEISDVQEGQIRWSKPLEFGNAPTRARRRVRDGDVLVSTVRTYLRAVAGVSNPPAEAVASTGFAVLRPESVESGFLSYALLNTTVLDEIVARSVGVSYPAINASELTSIKIPTPDREQQRAISSFLDRETAEIDAFIADQEELIELLTERRVSVHAAHFESIISFHSTSGGGRPLSAALRETDRRVGVSERELLSVSIHHGVVPWSELHEKEPVATDFASYKEVAAGDLVLNRMRAFQGAAGVAPQDGMVSPDYAVFRVSETCSSGFLGELLRSVPMIEAMKLHLRGIGSTESGAVRTPRVNVRDVLRIRAELPSLNDQRRILESLREQTAELDAAIADAREAIALSKERRAALISAAVTGKVDVRGLA